MVTGGFRLAPGSTDVDFGRVLEGDTATRTLTLTAEGRGSVTVEARYPSPFTGPATIEVPGGGQVDVPIVFHAGNGPAQGQAVEWEADRCVETQSPDDSACDPGSQCLVQGRCRAGKCLGIARTCDDNNRCTADGCSMSSGCVHTPTSCPAPSNPCHVAVCDAVTGCGEANADDGTVCGPVTCEQANLCAGGTCQKVATPEGFPCGPAIACLPEAQCHNKVCVRPDAGAWVMRWSARIDGTLGPDDALLERDGTLFFTACGVSPAPPPDGGADAGMLDGGLDAGPSVDAGAALDAGDDGGSSDAGPSVDAGPDLRCALQSYTPTGFERFVQRFESGQPEQLVQVGFHGAVVNGSQGLRLFSSRDGQPLASVSPGPVDSRSIASVADAGLVFVASDSDGGLALTWWSMQITDTVPLAGPVDALAVGTADVVWLTQGPLLAQSVARQAPVALWATDGGALRTLMIDGTRALAGRWNRVSTLRDGGLDVSVFDARPDGGLTGEAADAVSLMSTDTSLLFDRRCRSMPMSCADDDAQLWGRAVDTATGVPAWETVVVKDVSTDRLVAAQLVDFAPGSFAAVLRRDTDAGTLAAVRLFANGSTVAECALPAGSSAVEKALFTRDTLYTVISGPDGGSRLQAWPLNGLPMTTRAWPVMQGVSGERRARP